MFDANALQDVARVAARELALAPVRAERHVRLRALVRRRVRRRLPRRSEGAASSIPACLVVDLNDPAVASDPDGLLRRDAGGQPGAANADDHRTVAAQPAALRGRAAQRSTAARRAARSGPNGQAAPTGLTVGIPLVESRDAGGVEAIRWVPVVAGDPRGAGCGLSRRAVRSACVYLANEDDCGPLDADPLPDRGLAAVRVNYPYQAAHAQRLSIVGADRRRSAAAQRRQLHRGRRRRRAGDQHRAGRACSTTGRVGPYAGPYGLGRQFALAGRTLRPFRKLISAQAIYRREVVE